MLEIFFGTRIYLTGDKINPYESSVLIMNHRTRVDWGFLWLALFHCCQPNAHNVKYVLKSSLMHLPGPGNLFITVLLLNTLAMLIIIIVFIFTSKKK